MRTMDHRQNTLACSRREWVTEAQEQLQGGCTSSDMEDTRNTGEGMSPPGRPIRHRELRLDIVSGFASRVPIRVRILAQFAQPSREALRAVLGGGGALLQRLLFGHQSVDHGG
jgi:hypothetical protein